MPQRKPKIYREEVKDRHTTHWDWDYMTTEEIEEAFESQPDNIPEEQNEKSGIVARFLSLLGLSKQ